MSFCRPAALALLSASLVVSCAATAYASGVSARTPGRADSPRVQLGIDIDFYYWAGTNVAATAAADISYIKSLHANSVSISFPFYVGGIRSNEALAKSATPSPANLALLVSAARDAGLYVSLRPLMDQANIRPQWRGSWTPASAAKWFASYEAFLRPYAVMAQQQHVPEFIESAELTALSSSPYWKSVYKYLRRVYHGRLAVSNNFVPKPVKHLDVDGVYQLLDDYHPVNAPTSASVATLTRGWESFLATEARGITLSEIGIAAEDGAYRKPYAIGGVGKFNPQIQVRWFTAACDAVAKMHLGGVYFWAIPFGSALNQPPGPATAAYIADGAGAGAISACFKRLS